MTSFLSPKDIARSIGVSESSVKRWVDDGLIQASRTAGGHRRVELAEVVRFVRETETPIVNPEILGLPELPSSTAPSNDLEEFLVAGAAPQARGLILSRYLDGASLETLFDTKIRSAMESIGELWKEREDGVFIEHRALTICFQAVAQLRLTLQTPKADAPKCIGGAIPGDIYMLPSLMIATTLQSLGFESVNLGADTPYSALGQAIQATAPDLVWLSASAVPEPDTHSEQLKAFLGAQDTDSLFILGGREADHLRLPASDSIIRLATVAELSAFIRGHYGTNPGT